MSKKYLVVRHLPSGMEWYGKEVMEDSRAHSIVMQVAADRIDSLRLAIGSSPYESVILTRLILRECVFLLQEVEEQE